MLTDGSQTLDEVLTTYRENQPSMSACLHADGRTNAAILKEILTALLATDPAALSRVRTEKEGRIEQIAAHMHNAGNVVALVALDEKFIVRHQMKLTDSGRALTEATPYPWPVLKS